MTELCVTVSGIVVFLAVLAYCATSETDFFQRVQAPIEYRGEYCDEELRKVLAEALDEMFESFEDKVHELKGEWVAVIESFVDEEAITVPPVLEMEGESRLVFVIIGRGTRGNFSDQDVHKFFVTAGSICEVTV